MLNLKNTLDGYLKNVEVIGNTIQDTNNLANIRSVGDKVEGQELYNIPIQVDNGEGVSEVVEILSPVQLEKVGDVADRIICKDGVWGVEKNVKTVIFDGSERWTYLSSFSGNNIASFELQNYFKTDIGNKQVVISNRFVQNTTYLNPTKEGVHCQYLHFNIMLDKSKLTSLDNDGIKSWLSDNNVLAKHKSEQPQFIPLPHDQQVKLRTFAGQTNIAFLTEIPGQIKAQVPKSLGATVNTHTEQIADLHNSLDRVKKLEETTVSTIETGSSFTTVDATNNGYFEDIKLEGKTLVNLLKVKNDWICSSATSSMCYGKYNVIKQLEPGKTYTYCYFNLPSKITKAYLGNSTTSIEMVSWTTIDSMHTFVCSDDVATLTEVVPHFKTDNNETLTDSEIKNIKIMLLEGNLTNNSLEFFEGLMSVGQDVEEVSIESVNENLFDGKFTDGINTYGTLDIDRRVWFVLNSSVGDFSFKANAICSGTSYSKLELYASNSPNATSINDMRVVGVFSITNGVIEFTQNKISEKYIYICVPGTTSNVFTLNNIVISKGTTPKPYTPHQSDKKPLLYYNPTTETWEKPVLREWDTIEKHSDGKYYYHQRSEEIDYISGDEGLTDCVTDMNKTVKKISTEKVYECTNIDLMTYSGETNYIINSGAISPKSLLKVHNNISNVVKILQEKVSLLENTFIAGLKSVLSGDMYSLATILYPEDFEQNDNIEQDIMVIPE